MPVVLWVAVGFNVGLQESARELAWLLIPCYYVIYIIIIIETCNVAWQRTRDDLILSSFNFSIFSIFLIIMASVTLFCEELCVFSSKPYTRCSD